MRPHSFIRTLAVAALIAVPSLAMAAPDQNTNGNNNNGCRGGQWVNGQCVYNNNNNGNKSSNAAVATTAASATRVPNAAPYRARWDDLRAQERNASA